MFDNIIYSNEDLFDTSDNKISLRRYRKDLIFYASFDSTLTANYSLANPVPTGTGTLENFGVFSQFVRLLNSLTYVADNFESLDSEGTIRFRVRAGFNNGICYQTTKAGFSAPIVSGDYYYDVYINGVLDSTVFAHFTLGDTISNILGALTTSLVGIPISVINIPVTNAIQFYSQNNGDLIEIKEPTSIPGGGYSFIDMFGGMNTPILPNAPSTDTTIFSLGTSGANYISLVHNTDSELELTIVDGSGTTSVLRNLGIWSNSYSQFYTFELTWTESIVYFFIDGRIFSALPLTTNLSREGGTKSLILRSGGSITDLYDYDELEIYNIAQNFRSYTPATAPITQYSTTRPYIDVDLGNGYSIGEVSGLSLLCSSNCHFVAKIGSTFYYYYSGSWRLSDGTFSQSTTASNFEVNFNDLNFNPVLDVVVRIYFDSDGISESWIETLEIEQDMSGELPAIVTGSVALTGTVDLSEDFNITITTDQGVATVDCSAGAVDSTAVTLDEIKAAINAANVPGLDTVTSDDAGHLIFKTLTKGSEAYVSVSGADVADAIGIIFGDEEIDTGEDGTIEVISYQPLFDFVRFQLGAPVVPVELTDEQLNSCLQEAVWFYNRFRNSNENIYYYVLTGNAKDGYEVPAAIGGAEYIIDIVTKPRMPFGYSAAAPFGVQSIYMQHWFQKFGSLAEPGFLSDYWLTLSFMKDINITMGGEPYWDIKNNRIFVYPMPDDNMTIGIKYRALLSLDELLNDFQIKQYVLAKAKMLLGNIRSTFGNTIPGGGDNIQLNGAELIAQGKEELDTVKKEIMGQQEPLLMIWG
jgi:hypothetical protein